MSEFLTEVIDSGYASLDRFRAISQVGRTGSSSPVAASAGGSLGGLNSSLNLAKHAEQYKHFRGWSYVAISRIATRVSAQPIRIGKLLTTEESAKHAFMRRSLVSPTKIQQTTLKHFARKDNSHFEAIEQHILMDALTYPNDAMTRTAVIHHLCCNLMITGRSYMWFPQVEGNRLEAWPLPSHWVTPVHSKKRLFDSFLVQPTGSLSSEPYVIPAEEVAFWLNPDPSDPLGVISPMQSQAPAVAINEAIEESQYRAFKNGIFPPVMLRAGRLPGIDGTLGTGQRPILTADQRRELYSAVRAVHAESYNYGQPLIVDGLIEGVERISNSPQEMDFTTSDEYNRKRIMMSYGSNPIVAGDVETANRATATVAEELHCANAVNPLIVAIAEGLTCFLARREGKIVGDPTGENLVVYIELCRPVDPEQRHRECVVARANKDMTRTEYREIILNLPPLTDEQLEELEAETPEPIVPVVPQEDDDEESDEEEDDEKMSLLVTKSELQAAFKSDEFDEDLWIGFFGAMHDKQLSRAERGMLAVTKRYLASQSDAVTAEFRRLMTEMPSIINSPTASKTIASMIYSPRQWDQHMKDAFLSPIAELVVLGITMERAAQKSFSAKKLPNISDIINYALSSRLLGRVRDFLAGFFQSPTVTKINDTTEKKVNQVLAKAIDKGWHSTEIERQLKRVIRGIESGRAQAIASVSANGAINAGHTLQMMEAEADGAVLYKVWAGYNDDRIRDTHRAALFQRVKGAEALFKVGKYYAPYPCHYSLPDEEKAGCRCWVVSQVIEENG